MATDQAFRAGFDLFSYFTTNYFDASTFSPFLFFFFLPFQAFVVQIEPNPNPFLFPQLLCPCANAYAKGL